MSVDYNWPTDIHKIAYLWLNHKIYGRSRLEIVHVWNHKENTIPPNSGGSDRPLHALSAQPKQGVNP